MKNKNVCQMCEENTGRFWGYVKVVVEGDSVFYDSIQEVKKFLCELCFTEFAIKSHNWG